MSMYVDEVEELEQLASDPGIELPCLESAALPQLLSDGSQGLPYLPSAPAWPATLIVIVVEARCLGLGSFVGLRRRAQVQSGVAHVYLDNLPN